VGMYKAPELELSLMISFFVQCLVFYADYIV